MPLISVQEIINACQDSATNLRVSALSPAYRYQNISAVNSVYTIATTSAYLARILINDATAKTLNVYGASAVSAVQIIAALDAPSKGVVEFGVSTAGITVSGVSAHNVTVVWL